MKYDLLQTVLNGIADAYPVLDEEGRVTRANGAVTRVMRQKPEALIGKPASALLEQIQPGLGHLLQEALNAGEPQVGGLVVGESEAPLIVEVAPAPDGQTVRLQVRRDEPSQNDPRESEDRYRLFFESSPLPMWIYDPRTLRFVDVNAAAVAHYGYSRETFLQMSLRDIRPSEDVPALLEPDSRPSGTSSLVSRGRFRHRKADGSIIDVETFVNPVMFEGQTVHVEMANDVTDRTRIEEDLRKSQAELSAIVRGMGDVVLVIDSKGYYRDIAPTAAPLLYRPSNELLGRRMHDVLPADDADLFLNQIRKALETGEPQYVEYSLLIGDETIWFSGAVSPMSESRVVWVARDITDRKRNERALETARRDAENANHAKSDFLSRMSHELRSPLNGILGFAQLLSLETLDVEQRDSVEQILNGGRHLLALINEVLDIARIESGHLLLSMEPVHLHEVVSEALSLLRPLARERRVLLPSSLPADCQHFVRADRQRLKQVVLNLISNATKYNRAAGTVTVRCDEVAGERVRFTVRDTGPGIGADKLDRLFQPFDRLDRGNEGSEGTGLGLALSKALIEAMGGQIGVNSEVGRGSDFWIELPAESAPDGTVAPRPDPGTTVGVQAAVRCQTVLYIEDNLANIQLVQRIFAHRPAVDLIAVMQGTIGLEIARTRQIALIFLDLNLPDLKGEEVLLRLKGDPVTAAIPVLVLSPDASPGQMKRLLDSGAHDYITRPIELDRFLTIVDDILASDNVADRDPGDWAVGPVAPRPSPAGRN